MTRRLPAPVRAAIWLAWVLPAACATSGMAVINDDQEINPAFSLGTPGS